MNNSKKGLLILRKLTESNPLLDGQNFLIRVSQDKFKFREFSKIDQEKIKNPNTVKTCWLPVIKGNEFSNNRNDIPVLLTEDVADLVVNRIDTNVNYNIVDGFADITDNKIVGIKFKDIEKFTSMGSYTSDVPFDFVKINLDRFITEHKLQMCPDFQRGHVWTTKQQIAYIEYLFKGGKSGTTVYFNQPGWLNGFDGEFVVVDGLQRLTAITRFLENEIKVFGYYYRDYDRIDAEITIKFCINNLKTRAEVLKWYLEMNSGGVVHTEDELNRVRKMLLEEMNKDL